MSDNSEVNNNYMTELIVCRECKLAVQRQHLHWKANGCNYTNICEKCHLLADIRIKLYNMGRKLDEEKVYQLTYNDLIMLKKEIDNPVMRFSSWEEMRQHQVACMKALKR